MLPKQLVGTSAGAAIAVACLASGPEVALAACKRLYGETARIFRWRELLRGRGAFAHQTVYPAWLEAFVNETTLETLQASGASLHVAVTRPSRWQGLRVSVILGTLAYLADKKIWHRIHPRLPSRFGLRQEFIDLALCRDAAHARRVLLAAAAAPPIMAAVELHGGPAFDGGYTDNAPIPAQTPEQRRRTLVLLTRHYPSLPTSFRLEGRVYWQPSRPVPVSTWDCTARSTVDDAYQLGRNDGTEALRAGWIQRRSAHPPYR